MDVPAKKGIFPLLADQEFPIEILIVTEIHATVWPPQYNDVLFIFPMLEHT